MTKNEEHQKVVVSGILDNGGKLLMVKRSEYKAFLPGYWEFPGGKVNFGESAEDGLVRVFKEEVGLDIEVGQYLRTFNYVTMGAKRHTTELAYTVYAKEIGVVELGRDQVDYAWVDVTGAGGKYEHGAEIAETIKLVLDEVNGQAKGTKKIKTEANITTNYEVLQVFSDGGSRGNPGPSASGYVIMTTKNEILDEGGEYLGVTTNNQAEYQAVKLALEKVGRFSPRKIEFFVDSMLVVNQMNNKWKIKNKDLWPVHQAIKDLVKKFESVTFTHVKRELNTLADDQVNVVLDSHQGK